MLIYNLKEIIESVLNVQLIYRKKQKRYVCIG